MTFLIILLLFNLVSCFILVCFTKKYIETLRISGFFLTILLFFVSLLVWYEYDSRVIIGFQQYTCFSLMFQFGVDGIGLLFVLLTTSIYPIVILASWSVNIYLKELYNFLIFSELLLLIVFSILDLFGFYIFFELLLFPMIYLIGMWGSRARRIKASYYFFLYTIAGSLLMLFGLIFLYFEVGSTNFLVLFLNDIEIRKQKILWFLFFFTFAIKIPMFPFHIWLPEAHVEASTIGSVLLAALLLKLGTYGFLRILILMFPDAMYFFLPIVFVLCLLSIIFSSLILLRQIDIKRIIAYSSVAHMNFGVIGLFSQILESIEGGIYLMFSHGYSSGALFLCAGILYDRYHTRLLHYYSGFSLIMPLYAVCFFLIILANFGFPGTANFIGEFFIILGLIQFNNVGIILGLIIGLIFSVIYSILLYNRVCFGEMKIESFIHLYYADISRREFFLLCPLIFFIFFFGLFSPYLFDLFHGSAVQLLIILEK